METVWVSMRRSYVYKGKHYGPGSAVLVPVGLQAAMNLEEIDAPPVPGEEPLPVLAKLPAHLEMLDLDAVVALQAKDPRKKAVEMYEARIEVLTKPAE